MKMEKSSSSASEVSPTDCGTFQSPPKPGSHILPSPYFCNQKHLHNPTASSVTTPQHANSPTYFMTAPSAQSPSLSSMQSAAATSLPGLSSENYSSQSIYPNLWSLAKATYGCNKRTSNVPRQSSLLPLPHLLTLTPLNKHETLPPTNSFPSSCHQTHSENTTTIKPESSPSNPLAATNMCSSSRNMTATSYFQNR